jgi:hypothetical protein
MSFFKGLLVKIVPVYICDYDCYGFNKLNIFLKSLSYWDNR